jgi:kinetochor protein Mis14/NSL1
METTHRKIELQAPADLTYMIAKASKTARTKIDLHFPPSAAPEGEDDGMRRRVEELVNQVSGTQLIRDKPKMDA